MDDAIPTASGNTSRQTCVRIRIVTIITFLHVGLNHTITTAGHRAVIATQISIHRITVVPSFPAGVDDALMLDLNGHVAETNATHVFIVEDGVVRTPYTHACPEGITRDTVLQICRDKNIPLEVANIGIELCRALTAVRHAGLVHRDIKARNVMREAGGHIVVEGTPEQVAAHPGSHTGRVLAPLLRGVPTSVRADAGEAGPT